MLVYGSVEVQKYEFTYVSVIKINTFQKRVNACIGFGKGFKSMNLPMFQLWKFILFKNE